MKKKLTYRDKLLELAKIYNVKEIQEYIKRKKSLTSGQIELILRKNKIVIPKDFQTNFIKENISKPLSKASKKLDDLKSDSIKSINKFTKRINYFKENSFSAIVSFFSNLWKRIGYVGLAFLNIFPKLWLTVYNFFGSLLSDLFNGIYNQKINSNKANQAIIGFFIIIGIVTIIISGITTFNDPKKININKIVQEEKLIEKSKVEIKKEVKKLPKKDKKKLAKKEVKKTEIKKKEKKVEVILPDLNLKTETVLNLFKDVDYDLNRVRNKKIIKPIYFTQFPKDLDKIQSVKLKKETFIKIVLPLVVAENQKILDDRFKLNKLANKKMTTDKEKSWLRQKFKEYKVTGGKISELQKRMDIIPVSIAIAQAAKESGWGTSRFALEGNAIFGQWTWNGKGIEPLDRNKEQSHKILRFPILRASVKAYKNNLNTHKSYRQFREKRFVLRSRNKSIKGIKLIHTLDSYAQTGAEYTKALAKMMDQNDLGDFENVKLTNHVNKSQLEL